VSIALHAEGISRTHRGFTDHEHLNRTGFIHMNGRVTDPRIGRFAQPDPFAQAPYSSQCYNRYAYVVRRSACDERDHPLRLARRVRMADGRARLPRRAELGHNMKGLRVAYSEHFGYGMPVAGDEIAPFFDHDLYDALADATFTGLRGLATSLVGTNTQRRSPRVREILARTEGVSLERYLAARALETQAMLSIARVLKDYDLLATPRCRPRPTRPSARFRKERRLTPTATRSCTTPSPGRST
jgi:RHS repeat-associated protein